MPPKPGAAFPRLAFAPTASGPGSGRGFFVFFAYSPRTLDGRRARMRDIVHLTDDLAGLRAAGYSVIVDFDGTAESLNLALAGRHPAAPRLPPAGVLWNGHGARDGRLVEPAGERFGPADVQAPPDSGLRLFIFASCYTMVARDAWQARLGKSVRLHGWNAPLTKRANAEFFTPDPAVKDGLDDLLREHLQVRPQAAPAGAAELRALIGLDGQQYLATETPLEGALRPVQISRGDRMLAQKIATGDFYAARVTALADGCFQVDFDGETAWVGPHQVRRLSVPQAVPQLVGCSVLAPWTDGKFYCGVLLEARGQRCRVKLAGIDGPILARPDQIQPYGWLYPRLGDRVQAMRAGEDDVHPATLTETDGSRFLACWEDGAPPKWVDTWDVER